MTLKTVLVERWEQKREQSTLIRERRRRRGIEFSKYRVSSKEEGQENPEGE